MDKYTQDQFDRLRQWTLSLSIAVDNALPRMEAGLDGRNKFPSNCPSRQAAAAREFAKVQEKLSEVTAVVAAIEKALAAPPEFN